jgi:hypothetical protein
MHRSHRDAELFNGLTFKFDDSIKMQLQSALLSLEGLGILLVLAEYYLLVNLGP